MVASTARQKVLEFLRRRRFANVTQISTALEMSPAAVRHHLSILVADGRAIAMPGEARARRGRPQKVYRLSERLLGDNLEVLADVLLARLSEHLGIRKRDAAMQASGEELAARLGLVDSNLPPARRLEALVNKLNEAHYQARWEAGSQGPRILLGHCPYAAVIADHPELCLMDGSLLRKQVSARVEQTAKMDPSSNKPTQCVFVVGT